MRKKGIFLLILLLFLLMLTAVVWALTAPQTDSGLLRFQAGDIRLNLYYDEATGVYSLYLPSFASPDSLSASHNGKGSLRFSRGEQVYEGLHQVPLDQEVTMTVCYPWGAEETCLLRVLQCSAGQTICIETKEGTMDLINADQTHEAAVSVTILDSLGRQTYQGHANISGRGNGTWVWPKKPYDLAFPEPVSIEGMEDTSKLCLLAEYFDESKLRNGLAYHTGALMEIPYASGYEFADVYIDGVYNGIYGLTTKREYTKHILRDDLKAVFELSSSYKGNHFFTDYHTQIRIHHGTLDTILAPVETFEYALYNRDWDTVWNSADLTSWARKYAMDELYYNYDLPLTSQYYYLDGDGKIGCMLPWDYEWIFYPRMAPYDMDQERALAAYYQHGNWYEVLLESEPFRQEVIRVLNQELNTDFFERLETWLCDATGELTGSWHCDRYRWHSDYAASPASDGGSGLMSGYANTFRRNLDTRREFMLDLLENREGYCLILFFSEIGEFRKQTNLQLIVPMGTDLSAYHSQLLTSLTNLETVPLLSCTAEDGTPLQDVGIVQENLIFTAVYQPESEIRY